jgi:hypothetical protein
MFVSILILWFMFCNIVDQLISFFFIFLFFFFVYVFFFFYFIYIYILFFFFLRASLDDFLPFFEVDCREEKELMDKHARISGFNSDQAVIGLPTHC